MNSMLVKDHMTHNIVTLRPDMDIMEAVNLLCVRQVPGAPVLDPLGNFIGILMEKDCLEAVFNAAYHEERGGRVDTFMHKDVVCIEAEDDITDAAKCLIDSGFRGMPVLSNNTLVGMLNRSDILKAIVVCKK